MFCQYFIKVLTCFNVLASTDYQGTNGWDSASGLELDVTTGVSFEKAALVL